MARYYDFMLSKEFTEILASIDFSEDLRSQPGMAHVTQALVCVTFQRVYELLCDQGDKMKEDEGPIENDYGEIIFCAKREVNSFIGWAISDLIRKILRLIGAWTSKDEGRREEEDAKAKKELSFLKDLRWLHADAVLDKNYMRDCYSDQMMIQNNGGLALVDKHYFDFGKELMHLVSNAFTPMHIEKEGREALAKAWERVNEGVEKLELKRKFLECASRFEDMNDQEKLAMFEKMKEKVCNSRFNVATEAYKQHLKRGGKHYVAVAFRTGLSSKTGTEAEKNVKTTKEGWE
jgi:hypothetical protein